MPTNVVIAQTTVEDETQATALARGAVESRLAACAHIDPPLRAVYRWLGQLQDGREWRVSYKTTRDRLPALAAWVAAEHPYDVPEWIVLPVESGSDAYLEWVAAEVLPEGE